MANAGLTDLLGGAIVDRQFCATLLRNPQAVLAKFDLSHEEREAIVSIRAISLDDFAAQLYAWMVGQGNGYGTVHGHDEPRLSQLRPIAVYQPQMTTALPV
jgi:hypothetical protein